MTRGSTPKQKQSRLLHPDTSQYKLWSFSMAAMAVIGMLFLAACGGGGGGGGSTTTGGGGSEVAASLSSYVMPGELSAVPSKESDRTVSLKSALRTFAKAAYDDLDTDYSNAPTRKFVEEHSLEQFEILEDVLTALNQTKYYEEIGNDPYKAMVAMVGDGEEGGKGQKSLEAWVVEADITDADGNVVEPENAVEGVDYNVRVRAWIEEEDELIKAEFVITEEPTQNSDGSYLDYGAWTLNVKFGDTSDEFFAASCEVGAGGESIIKLHEVFGEEGPGSGGLDAEIKAVMYRAADTGYGKVSHPDWEALWGPDGGGDFTEMPMKNVIYAYNDDYLALDDGTSETVKDRNNVEDMTHMYGVFNAATGDDIMKSKQFGFPIKFTVNGVTKRGYYGAWQGRHQLWMEFGDGQGAAALEGQEVIKEDHHSDSDATAQTYTIGKTFNGTLVKRDYVTASLNDIKNIPVEIWVNQDYQLFYNSGDSKWYHCPAVNWSTFPPSCDETPVDFAAEIGFDSLAVGANDTRKYVNIGGWDETNQQDKQFVYLPANTINSNTAGLYEAEQNQYGQSVAKQPLVAINTTNVSQLWIWVGGSLYVEYKGATEGWVEKELLSFDERNWMPEFGTNDKPYKLPAGRELYINLQGASYVVRKDLQGKVTVKLELQTAVNPENATTLVPAGTVFKEPWSDFNSTYELDTDPASSTYLMLVYKTIGDNDKDQSGDTANVGDLLTTGMWGLEATIGGQAYDFNWEYSGDGGWGSVTYLMDGTDYVLLDDPVRFDSITVDHNGVEKTLALQYDGWMMGLPDMYYELSKNDWVMTAEISEKILNLPAGTPVTESATGTAYVLKPLEISQFLIEASADTATAGLDTLLVDADSVDLTTVPDFVEHNMGTMPSGTTIKYSEGILVQ